MSHTPGPWKVIQQMSMHARYMWGWMATDSAERVDGIVNLEWEVGARSEANVRLIAVAPELLAFAKAYVDQYRRYQMTNTIDAKHDAVGYLRELADAAIAKAEGRT